MSDIESTTKITVEINTASKFNLQRDHSVEVRPDKFTGLPDGVSALHHRWSGVGVTVKGTTIVCTVEVKGLQIFLTRTGATSRKAVASQRPVSKL